MLAELVYFSRLLRVTYEGRLSMLELAEKVVL